MRLAKESVDRLKCNSKGVAEITVDYSSVFEIERLFFCTETHTAKTREQTMKESGFFLLNLSIKGRPNYGYLVSRWDLRAVTCLDPAILSVV